MDGEYENMSGRFGKNLSKQKDFWVEFFANRRDGGHRSSAEEFISKEAKDPPRNNIGIFLDCTQPFSQASSLI
jgi:hypothetical protein